ncbi:MAG: hypothetical protein RMM17_12575 [Acidobacteriota bacterium]|nr:hypothetical protein [Blastocatellia bacterium]MDW8413505.1 hypothetical protein [Acidobacteriota bacterium]
MPPRSVSAVSLSFFLLQLFHHSRNGAIENALWMCNISNLLLAFAVAARSELLASVASMWLILGLPLWIIDLVEFGDVSLSTLLAHIGGASVSFWTLHSIGGIRRGCWLLAVGWYLLVQQLCRLWTKAQLNVNLAHAPRALGLLTVDDYRLYWLLTTILAALLLLLLERFWQSPKGLFSKHVDHTGKDCRELRDIY